MCADTPRTLIFHVDINSCYTSCEKLLDPSIGNRPVLVLSNNDGCIISLDAAAKALGFTMGQPWFTVQEKAKELGVVVRSSNYELYGDISHRVMLLLESYAQEFEQYSIDEAFLTITASLPQAQTLARRIKDDLARRVGVPVCVGVGESKTLAKLANRTAKKIPALRGVCVWDALPPQRVDALLSTLPAEEIWGVGSRVAQKLAGMGILSVQDLKEAPLGLVRKRFSVVIMRTVLELRGVRAIELEPERVFKDQMMYSRSFSDPVTSEDTMRQVLSIYAQRASGRLVKSGQVAGLVSAFCSTSRYATGGFVRADVQVKLSAPTADPIILTQTCAQLLERATFGMVKYAKAGVVVSDLTPAGATALLDPFALIHETRDIAGLVQSIKEKCGPRSLGVGYGGLAQSPTWEMKREMLSRRGTTHWAELPVAVIK